MTHTAPRSARRRRLALGVAAATAASFLAVAPAAAQQRGGDAQVAAQCRAAGGSWRPTTVNGVEGHGCRINIAYGCGIDLAYDANGNPMGGDAWCLGGYVSWGRP